MGTIGATWMVAKVDGSQVLRGVDEEQLGWAIAYLMGDRAEGASEVISGQVAEALAPLPFDFGELLTGVAVRREVTE